MAEVESITAETTEENEESEGSEGSEDDDTVEGKEKKQKKRKKEVEIDLSEAPEEIPEIRSIDLLERNTSSFRCLAQIAMSSSSLMNQRMRFFPPIPDPGLDEALSYLRKMYFIKSKLRTNCKT